jgi:hypothetical protein
MKVIAIVFTGLWVVGVLIVGLNWMGSEYALIEKDNGDGTVTFRDGPDKATSTKGEFFAVALKNSLIMVLFFPTLPYVGVMLVVGIVWLFLRGRNKPFEEAGWETSGDGMTMSERRAKLKSQPPKEK